MQAITYQRRTIISPSQYNLNNQIEYNRHGNYLKELCTSYTLFEDRDFDVDSHNSRILQFLVFYFNGNKKAEEVFPEMNYKLHKNLLFVGTPGTGKTLLMLALSDYLRLTKNPLYFKNTSVTHLLNHFKLNNHIDAFTYRQQNSKKFEGEPEHICLNDLGIEIDKQKHFGTDVAQIIDEFLFARYEIYQNQHKRYHITSNLTLADFQKGYESRLLDRFKSFNVIPFNGDSRRK